MTKEERNVIHYLYLSLQKWQHFDANASHLMTSFHSTTYTNNIYTLMYIYL